VTGWREYAECRRLLFAAPSRSGLAETKSGGPRPAAGRKTVE
jgi:hypothetical protein